MSRIDLHLHTTHSDGSLSPTEVLRLAHKAGNAHIHLTGLSDFFVTQFSAADVQAAKPHPAMFHRAMQFAGVSPRHTLHVGDHAVHDIEGARTAGVRSVWVNRHNEPWLQEDFVADYEVENLYGLLELLK